MFARDIDDDKLYKSVPLSRVFVLFFFFFLKTKTSEILLVTSMNRYNFTRVYEKVCKFFETRCWFRSETSVLHIFSFLLLFFNIHLLNSGFYFIFYLIFFPFIKSDGWWKNCDAIDTRTDVNLRILCVYSISEIWGK